MTIDLLLNQLANQLTHQCLDRWRKGDKGGPTLKAHAARYFVPNAFAIASIRRMSMMFVGVSGDRVEAMYKTMIEANRLTWEGYNDAQAQQAYDDWYNSQPK